jgi:hypothetical protein
MGRYQDFEKYRRDKAERQILVREVFRYRLLPIRFTQESIDGKQILRHSKGERLCPDRHPYIELGVSDLGRRGELGRVAFRDARAGISARRSSP